jgi:hypothetical protein
MRKWQSDEELLRRRRAAIRQRQIAQQRNAERERLFWSWFIPLCILLAIIGLVWGAIAH